MNSSFKSVDMANRKTVSVSISPELLDFVEKMLTGGRYGNVSEVVRAALRQLQERELAFQAHRAAIETGTLKQPGVSSHA